MKKKNIVLQLLATVCAISSFSCSGKSETDKKEAVEESTKVVVEVDSTAMVTQATELIDFVLMSVEAGDVEGAMGPLQDALSYKTGLIDSGQVECEKIYTEHLRILYGQNKKTFDIASSESHDFKDLVDRLLAEP